MYCSVSVSHISLCVFVIFNTPEGLRRKEILNNVCVWWGGGMRKDGGGGDGGGRNGRGRRNAAPYFL